MVRLKRAEKLRMAFGLTDFNPTMVRLKPAEVKEAKTDNILFQSHNGSIKTVCGCPDAGCYSLFQSHNGSIKT